MEKLTCELDMVTNVSDQTLLAISAMPSLFPRLLPSDSPGGPCVLPSSVSPDSCVSVWQRLLLVKEQKAKAMMDEVTDDAPPATPQDSATNKTLLIGTLGTGRPHRRGSGYGSGRQMTSPQCLYQEGGAPNPLSLTLLKLMYAACLCRGCGAAVGGGGGAAHHGGRAAVADRGL